MAKFDKDGKQIDAYTPSQGELDALWQYVQVLPEPAQGYTLGNLRVAGSKQSLASVEKQADALVQAGKLSKRYNPSLTGKGGWVTYSKAVS